MQDGSGRVPQGFGENSVLSQGTEGDLHAPGTVNLLDLPVGGGFQTVNPAAAQQLHRQTVQVFSAGADDDLVAADPDTAVAGQVAAQGILQFAAAGVRRTDQDFLPVFGEHAAHDAREGWKGKDVPFRRGHGQRSPPFRAGGGLGKAVRFPVDHVVSAAGPRLRIPFLAEQLDAVVGRYAADAPVPGLGTAGGKAAAEGTDAGEDLLPEGFIQCQVGRFLIFHLVL